MFPHRLSGVQINFNFPYVKTYSQDGHRKGKICIRTDFSTIPGIRKDFLKNLKNTDFQQFSSRPHKILLSKEMDYISKETPRLFMFGAIGIFDFIDFYSKSFAVFVLSLCQKILKIKRIDEQR